MTTYRTIVGLDIGGNTVKAARIVKHGRRWKTVQTEMLRLPADSRNAPAPMVARWLQTNGLSKYPVALSLSGHSVMFQTIVIRDEDPRSLEQMAAVEVARFQEMAAEETAHAVIEVKAGDGKRRLLLVMARAALLEDMLHSYREQDINIVGLVPATIAIFNFTSPLLENRAEPYIVADAGVSRTDFGVCLGESLLFGRALSGLGASGGQGSVESDIEGVANAWSRDLKSALSMYRGLFRQPDQQPAAIVLSGDACEIPGFTDAVRRHAGLEIINLTERLKVSYPREPQRFAAAIGAAISLMNGATNADLLPPAAREELLLKTQKRYWAAAGITGILIFLVLLTGAYRNARRAQHQYDRDLEVARRCDELGRQIDIQRRRGEIIFSMAAPLMELVANATIAQDLIIAIANHLAPEDVITMIGDANLYFNTMAPDTRTRAPARRTDVSGARTPGLYGRGHSRDQADDRTADKRSNTKINRVIIEGFTPNHDLSTVGALIDRLREQPFIDQHTDMLPDDQLVGENVWTNRLPTSNMRHFVIDVRLQPPEGRNP